MGHLLIRINNFNIERLSGNRLSEKIKILCSLHMLYNNQYQIGK